MYSVRQEEALQTRGRNVMISVRLRSMGNEFLMDLSLHSKKGNNRNPNAGKVAPTLRL